MEGMSLPADAVRGHNCGVTAVAIMAGVSFWTAFERVAIARGRANNSRWKGRSNHADRVKALASLGVALNEVPGLRRMTLDTFVRRYAHPGVRYMVRTTGHVQIVKDGHVTDQAGCVPIAKHWGRRKFVTLVHTSNKEPTP